MSRSPALYLGSLTTGSGADIRSHDTQVRLARALLALPTTQPAPQARDEQAKKTA